MSCAYVALGSNLGTPRYQLDQAVRALEALPDTHVIQVSTYYQNPAVYKDPSIENPPQADYINAVAKLETSLDPLGILAHLEAIERQQARTRITPWGPRTLDLDLLLLDDLILDTPTLTLPHPRLHLRAFVLIPLAEITPNLILPNGHSLQTYITPAMHASMRPLTESVVF